MTGIFADADLLADIVELEQNNARLRGAIRVLRDDLATARAALDTQESATELMREVYEVFGGDCWNDSAVTKTWATRARSVMKRVARKLNIKEQK